MVQCNIKSQLKSQFGLVSITAPSSRQVSEMIRMRLGVYRFDQRHGIPTLAIAALDLMLCPSSSKLSHTKEIVQQSLRVSYSHLLGRAHLSKDLMRALLSRLVATDFG
jgi:hypothetical protein